MHAFPYRTPFRISAERKREGLFSSLSQRQEFNNEHSHPLAATAADFSVATSVDTVLLVAPIFALHCRPLSTDEIKLVD